TLQKVDGLAHGTPSKSPSISNLSGVLDVPHEAPLLRAAQVDSAIVDRMPRAVNADVALHARHGVVDFGPDTKLAVWIQTHMTNWIQTHMTNDSPFMHEHASLPDVQPELEDSLHHDIVTT